MMNQLSILALAAVLFAQAPTAQHESPFACNLQAFTAAQRTRHFNELGPMLRRLKTGVRELSNGYEFQFPGDPKTVALLTEWAVQERRCCPFFDIDLRLGKEGGPAVMRLTGREGTKQFIEIVGTEWIKR
jgi:hypothetical protein